MVHGLKAATFDMPAKPRDPSVQEIIQAARARQAPSGDRPGSQGAWGLSSVTAILLWSAFTPLDFGPLAWLALVPIIVLIRLPHSPRWMYSALYLTGLINMLATLQWMRLGDPTMYIALAALAAYCAAYFPVFVALSRLACQRWSVPMVIAVPVIWTGLEYCRAHLITGFPWYFLGHSQYRWLELIQISDLTGAYGVSFLVATGNAALAGLIPARWLHRLRLLGSEDRLLQSAIPFRAALVPVLAAAVLLGGVLGYGVVRRQQAAFTQGPRVALIQGNFPASLRQRGPTADEQYITHARLTGLAVREQPDLIVWPEAMFPAPLLDAAPGVTDEQLASLLPPHVDISVWTDRRIQRDLAKESQKAGAALLWGIHSARAEPEHVRQCNSAAFVTPEQGFVGTYDKRHLVPFGEYLPLRNVLPFLQRFTPYGGNAGLNAGTEPVVFAYKSWRFAPIICFEDTVPHVVRTAAAAGQQAAGGKTDVLVNLTNDGWFHGSSELDQHLITAVFRSVECRTPMVRAVNTGISAIIDGDGAIVEPDIFIDGDWRKDSPHPPRKSMRDPRTGKRHRQLTAALVHTVPLDNRTSLYVRLGDWFAGACALCVSLILAGAVIGRYAAAKRSAA